MAMKNTVKLMKNNTKPLKTPLKPKVIGGEHGGDEHDADAGEDHARGHVEAVHVRLNKCF